MKLTVLPQREGSPKPRASRHGHPWTQDEKDALVRRYKAGVPISDLLILHGRSLGGIVSELGRQGFDWRKTDV